MSRKSRMRRAQREQAIPEDEIEVLDSPQDAEEVHEIEISEEDPVSVLKREVEKHKAREAEAEQRAADERQRRELLERQTEGYASTQLASDKALLEQSFAVADAKVEEAKRALAAASYEGRWDDAADAQRTLVRLESAMIRYSERYQELERQEKAPKPQHSSSSADSYEAMAAQIAEPDVRQWALDHKDDLIKPARQRLAFAANDLALARGLKPGTDEYLNFLDDQMGYEMESQEEEDVTPARVAPARRAPPVSAPVTRRGGGKVQSVTLSPEDKRWANQLGISEKDYAKSKSAAMRDDRFNRYSGRT